MTLSLLDYDTNLQDTNPTYVPVAATSLMQSPDVLDGFCPIDIGEFLLVPDLHASSPFLVLSDHSLAMVVYMSQPSPFPKILRLLASHVCSAHAMHPWQSGEGRPIVPEGIPNNGVAVRSKVCSCRTTGWLLRKFSSNPMFESIEGISGDILFNHSGFAGGVPSSSIVEVFLGHGTRGPRKPTMFLFWRKAGLERIHGGFQKWGYQNDWLIMENPIKIY